MRIETTSITTLLFDWDGTLFDSDHRGFLAFQKTFDELGISFDRQAYEACYSPNWYLMYEFLKLPRELWTQADDQWTVHYGEEPPLMVAGAQDTLSELNRRGYRMGVVSSGSQRRVRREIHQLSLTSLFHVVVCNEDIVNKKPHPEGLIKAITTLDAPVDQTCYVGDAPEDIQMGKNARVMTIGVRSSYPSSRFLAQARPDINLEQIGGLLLHFPKDHLKIRSE